MVSKMKFACVNIFSQRVHLKRLVELLPGYGLKSESNIVLEIENPGFLTVFDAAGISQVNSRRIICLITISVLLFTLASIFIDSALPLLFLTLGLLIVYAVLSKKRATRLASFERDYPALLISLASSVRTGLDPLTALLNSKELFSKTSEMHRELNDLNKKVVEGLSEEMVLRGFGAGVPHPDLPLFRCAFILSRRQGASISECLKRLARVTRQRQSFRRKIKSAVAMQKLSAIGIGFCAIVIAGIQFFSNPDAVESALAHPMGSMVLSCGGSLIVFGMIWMFQITRPKV